MILQRSTAQFRVLNSLAQSQNWDFDAIVRGPRAYFSRRDEFNQVIGTPEARQLLDIAQQKPANFSTLIEAKFDKPGPWSYFDKRVSCLSCG